MQAKSGLDFYIKLVYIFSHFRFFENGQTPGRNARRAVECALFRRGFYDSRQPSPISGAKSVYLSPVTAATSTDTFSTASAPSGISPAPTCSAGATRPKAAQTA
jgi:hypothetical protein